MKPLKNNENRREERAHFHKKVQERYQEKYPIVRGIVRINSYGTGFVDDETKGISYEIPTDLLHTATHNDTWIFHVPVEKVSEVTQWRK